MSDLRLVKTIVNRVEAHLKVGDYQHQSIPKSSNIHIQQAEDKHLVVNPLTNTAGEVSAVS